VGRLFDPIREKQNVIFWRPGEFDIYYQVHSPDYVNMDKDEALKDFLYRIDHYKVRNLYKLILFKAIGFLGGTKDWV
jgi:hypothetical protein